MRLISSRRYWTAGNLRRFDQQWLRGAGWLLVAGIAISLVTGFVGLAAFLAGRFLMALGGFIAMSDRRYRLRVRQKMAELAGTAPAA